MKRKIRHKSFNASLAIEDDNFINTPRPAQRQWWVNRALKEMQDELVHLNELSSRVIAGSSERMELNREEAALDDHEIMEDWQIPIMKKMASLITNKNADILEIGMGRGVASSFIQELTPRTHTIIECSDDIVHRAYPEWLRQYPDSDINMIHSLWQDCIPQLSIYDGILFHTYPLSDEEFVQTVVKDTTFAAHFLETASHLLKPGGALTYLTNEIDSLSRSHQRVLFKHFTSFTLSIVDELPIPSDTKDAHWVNQMVVIKATK